jgi:hypothetical protein
MIPDRVAVTTVLSASLYDGRRWETVKRNAITSIYEKDISDHFVPDRQASPPFARTRHVRGGICDTLTYSISCVSCDRMRESGVHHDRKHDLPRWS